VIEIAELGDDELSRVAAVVERALEEAPDNVKDAVATGFIEGAMTATASSPDGARFLRRLGPHGRKYARAWDEFGGLRTPGVWDET
jgi:hypothetical protein